MCDVFNFYVFVCSDASTVQGWRVLDHARMHKCAGAADVEEMTSGLRACEERHDDCTATNDYQLMNQSMMPRLDRKILL